MLALEKFHISNLEELPVHFEPQILWILKGCSENQSRYTETR